MIEYITVGLGITTGIATVIAVVYKRGIHEGMDTACEVQIKKDIKFIKTDLSDAKEEAILEHKEIRDDITNMRSDIAQIKGSTKVIEGIVTKYMSK